MSIVRRLIMRLIEIKNIMKRVSIVCMLMKLWKWIVLMKKVLMLFRLKICFIMIVLMIISVNCVLKVVI